MHSLHRSRVCNLAELVLQELVQKIRYLATIRNKLVHEYGFNEIPVSWLVTLLPKCEGAKAHAALQAGKLR